MWDFSIEYFYFISALDVAVTLKINLKVLHVILYNSCEYLNVKYTKYIGHFLVADSYLLMAVDRLNYADAPNRFLIWIPVLENLLRHVFAEDVHSYAKVRYFILRQRCYLCHPRAHIVFDSICIIENNFVFRSLFLICQAIFVCIKTKWRRIVRIMAENNLFSLSEW